MNTNDETAAKTTRKGDEVYVDLSFIVQGHVKQTIKLHDPNLDLARLLADLRSGAVFTTIQEGGSVEIVEDGRVLATVISVENECEYDEFELGDEGKYRLVPVMGMKGLLSRAPI